MVCLVKKNYKLCYTRNLSSILFGTKTMKKLVQGIVDFRKNFTEEQRALFSKLALGQKPDAFFVACSDSRVVPNLFASKNPGDVFVLRNIGNMIPPSTSAIYDTSACAALELSVLVLNVKDIIICGHSECGAMQALERGLDTVSKPNLRAWLAYGQAAQKKVANQLIINPDLPLYDQISQMNVLEQMEHVKSYTFVQERLDQNAIRIHGIWFDIKHADVYYYESGVNKFVLIDEQEAPLILERLQ